MREQRRDILGGLGKLPELPASMYQSIKSFAFKSLQTYRSPEGVVDGNMTMFREPEDALFEGELRIGGPHRGQKPVFRDDVLTQERRRCTR